MIRCRFLTRVSLGVIALMGLASGARADFEVQFSVLGSGGNSDTVTFNVAAGTVTVNLAGGGSTNAVTGGAGSQPFLVSFDNTSGAKELDINNNGAVLFRLDGFTIKTNISSSNSPGGTSANIGLSDAAITNTNGSTKTLTITTGDQDFTSPTAPLVSVTSSFSATAIGTNSAVKTTVTSTSYIDTTNTLFGQQQQVIPSSSKSFGVGQSASDNESSNLSGTPTPYSMTQVLGVQLGAGNALRSLSGDTEVDAITPVPGGLILVLTALPCLGGAWLYGRRQKMPLLTD